MKFIYAGQEFEFRGEYRPPNRGDRFLPENDGAGYVDVATTDWSRNPQLQYHTRAIVHLVRKEHVFGGVKYVETGEDPRRLQVGEVGILVKTGNLVAVGPEGYVQENYVPLKPVEVL